jgi:hypothetical protein
MSQLNPFSEEYHNSLAELTQLFSEAILVLKKEHILADESLKKKFPSIRLTNIEQKKAHEFTKEMLDFLNTNSHRSQKIAQQISINDFEDLKLNINNGNVLNEDELKNLDILLFSLDEERSVLFRKLTMNRI